MSRREKTDFILEQVALCIQKGDWTQGGILSRKIGTKYFTRKPTKTPEQEAKDKKEREEKEKNRSVDDPPIEPEDDVTDLKLRYYEQQILLAKHDDKYLEACKHYRQVLDTQAVEDTPAQLQAVRIQSRCSPLVLTSNRPFKESPTSSFLHHTTTNNLISYTASKPTPAIPTSHGNRNFYDYLRSQRSCAGQWLVSNSPST